jgi:hypothetical protein
MAPNSIDTNALEFSSKLSELSNLPNSDTLAQLNNINSKMPNLNDDQLNNTMNITTNIHDLKRNLINEEEFRSINHLEPIHIFLKIKPLTKEEMLKQHDQVIYKYLNLKINQKT